MLKKLIPLFFLAIVAGESAAIASDLEKEKRWADQVIGDLFDGEPLYLNDGVQDFLSLAIEAEEPKSTGVVVIHGLGVHPDWPQVVNPIRVVLAEQGWNTLSIQMPILGNDVDGVEYQKLLPEVPGRIDAAAAHLKQNGAEKIVLIAHSMGSRMTNYYLAEAANKQADIAAYIGIGMNSGNEGFIRKINLPMLDLYGEQDLEGVLASAKSRAGAAQHNANYQQQVVAEAGHFFEGMEDELLTVVSNWLNKQGL